MQPTPTIAALADRIPDLPPWTAGVAAVTVPLLVWVLWRLQVLSVEVLRWRLLKLLRHAKWLYNTVSWLGTFLHEMSHATVLLLSGHGIKQFRVRSDHGHVLPRRMRKGPVGFLFFLVAALAPLFGPPVLALVALELLLPGDLFAWTTASIGLAAAVRLFEEFLVRFPWELLQAIAHLDLSRGWHAAALAAILFGIPGSRPSHVKGSRFHGEDDEGDVAVVRKKVRQNPWPLLGFLAVVLAAYWPLVQWAPAVYWYPFEAVWAVAVAAVVLALVGAVWWSVVAWGFGAQAWTWWIPLAALVGLQVFGHQADWSVPIVNGASFGAFAGAAIALRLLLPRDRVKRRLGF